jgi:hypothetical protein
VRLSDTKVAQSNLYLSVLPLCCDLEGIEMLTISELTMCIEALASLEMEFGERHERTALIKRLSEARERLRAEPQWVGQPPDKAHHTNRNG